MNVEDLLRTVHGQLEMAEGHQSDARVAILKAYQIGLIAAVEECQKLAETSPSLRPDLLRLCVRMRARAKDARF